MVRTETRIQGLSWLGQVFIPQVTPETVGNPEGFLKEQSEEKGEQEAQRQELGIWSVDTEHQ